MATLFVTPDPVQTGNPITVSGDGYPPNAPVVMAYANPNPGATFNVYTDSLGKLAFWRTIYGDGSARFSLTAYVHQRGKKGWRLQEVAHVEFGVLP